MTNPSVLDRRDLALRKLLGLVMKHPWSARSAGARIEPRLTDYVERLNEEKRTSIRRTLVLVEVAKKQLLAADLMNADSTVEIDPDRLPEDIEELAIRSKRLLKQWEAESYRGLGRFDSYVGHDLDVLRGHLENARGTGWDLDSHTGLESYTIALSRVWSQGKYPPQHFADELDPAKAINTWATRETGVLELLRLALNDFPRSSRTDEQWWEFGILFLLALDEVFDGSEIALSHPLTWRRESGGGLDSPGRSIIRHMLPGKATKSDEERTEPILPALESVVKHLGWDRPVTPIALAQGRVIEQKPIVITPDPVVLTLGAPPPVITTKAGEQAVFKKTGSAWLVEFNGVQAALKDSAGVIYLQRLLQNPGRPVNVWVLETGREPSPELMVEPQPVMDERALAQALERMAGLEARQTDGSQLSEEEKQELEDIQRLVGKATKPGGTSRTMPAELEQCRNRVKNALRDALKGVEDAHPALSTHLEESLKRRGSFDPSYLPAFLIHWVTA